MDIFEIILIVCINILSIIITAYFARKGHNKADKEDIRNISFESELGKNLATKQDLEGITQMVESVRNEVSFENQRKHDFINERKTVFVDILTLVEGILNNSNNLLYFLYDETAIDEMKHIIMNTNEKMLAPNHNSRIILVTFDNDETCNQILELVHKTTAFAGLVCTTAINARNTMNSIKTSLSYLDNHPNRELLDKLTEHRELLHSFSDDYKLKKKEQWSSVQTELDTYISVLYALFKVQFHIKADLKFESNLKDTNF